MFGLDFGLGDTMNMAMNFAIMQQMEDEEKEKELEEEAKWAAANSKIMRRDFTDFEDDEF